MRFGGVLGFCGGVVAGIFVIPPPGHLLRTLARVAQPASQVSQNYNLPAVTTLFDELNVPPRPSASALMLSCCRCDAAASGAGKGSASRDAKQRQMIVEMATLPSAAECTQTKTSRSQATFMTCPALQEQEQAIPCFSYSIISSPEF